MAKSIPTFPLVLTLVLVVALITAGGIAIGFAQTITLLAIVATFVVFYLLIRTSLA